MRPCLKLLDGATATNGAPANTAAANDLVSMQKVGESFRFEVGKKLFFEGRFKVNDATQ